MFGTRQAGFVGAVVLLSSVAASATELQPRMGQPLNGLTVDQLARFNAGATAFGRVFSAAEGLGPVMNQQSCASCHNNPVGGSGAITVTRFGFFDAKGGGFDPLEAFGGSLLQSQTISEGCAETMSGFANVMTTRITTSTLGLGLIESIDGDDILALEDPEPGISGRAHMVPGLEDPPMSPLRVGRLGWKAQLATVLSFSGDATLNEMGITNALVPNENDPNGINPPDLASCDAVADPEDVEDGEGFFFIERVTDFQRFLAQPPQTPKSGMAGEAIFMSVGCGDCHVPSYTTLDNPMIEDALRNKTIRPYSDFLLHDMGQLGDGIGQGDADVREMKTPPLWGIRVRDPMLHDGRAAAGTFATRMATAIAEHNAFGSEAAPSALAYAALLPADKTKVIAFLDSLGRAEFDFDGDNAIGGPDLTQFEACFTGPGSFYTPDDTCSIADVDQDGDVDADDALLFATVYAGPGADCNGNSVVDPLDLLIASSTDCNSNLVPDECDAESQDIPLFVAVALGLNNDPTLQCMLDKNADGSVNGADIPAYIDNLYGP